VPKKSTLQSEKFEAREAVCKELRQSFSALRLIHTEQRYLQARDNLQWIGIPLVTSMMMWNAVCGWSGETFEDEDVEVEMGCSVGSGSILVPVSHRL
jgi:hypothetical protein